MDLKHINWNFGENCIYKISMGNKAYVGQTKVGYQRIYQHFRAAYETLDDSDAPAPKMRTTKIQDIKIEIWDSEPWGFAEDVWKDFSSKFAIKGADNSQAVFFGSTMFTELDVAEIMHILHDSFSGNGKLCNPQMGGQVPSAKMVVGGQEYPRVIMRTMTPQEGYSALATAVSGDISSIINKVQNEIFSPKWPEIYQKNYKEQLKKDLNSDEAQTWEHFFNETLLPALINAVQDELAKELVSDSSGIANIDKARVKSVSKGRRAGVVGSVSQVIKKFLTAKSHIFEEIVHLLYGNVDTIRTKPTLTTNLDGDAMAHYLATRVSSIVWSKRTGIRALTDEDLSGDRVISESRGSEGGDYVRRWTTVVDYKRPRAPGWLDAVINSPVTPGQILKDNFMVRMSYLVFNYYVMKVKERKDISSVSAYAGRFKGAAKNNEEGTKESTSDGQISLEYGRISEENSGEHYFVTPDSLGFDHTLSSRVRQAYENAGISGYHGLWTEFYSWMIDAWRSEHHSPVFTCIQSGGGHKKPVSYYIYSSIYFVYRFNKPTVGNSPAVY